MAEKDFPGWHGTTIIGVRKGGKVVVAGDGQVSLGQTVIKGTARKVRRLSPGGYDVVAGFAGSTADAFTLLERLEAKLEATPGQLQRAAVELAKDWRTDKYLQKLEAMLIVTDGADLYVVTGAGDVPTWIRAPSRWWNTPFLSFAPSSYRGFSEERASRKGSCPAAASS